MLYSSNDYIHTSASSTVTNWLTFSGVQLAQKSHFYGFDFFAIVYYIYELNATGCYCRPKIQQSFCITNNECYCCTYRVT